jgi:acetyl-CoA carboxylase biotin carboxyl carrier protein
VSEGRITHEEIKDLIDLVREKDINELVLERDGEKETLVIKRIPPAPAPVVVAPPAAGPMQYLGQPAFPMAGPAPASHPGPAAPTAEEPSEAVYHKVAAPMVGTFYRAPDPKQDPFVRVGDMVVKDQVVAIIEAMKIMNEIKSDLAGRCVKILVENGQPVEYGQPLMLLEPV